MRKQLKMPKPRVEDPVTSPPWMARNIPDADGRESNAWEIVADSPHVDGKTQVVCTLNGPWSKRNYAANAYLLASSHCLRTALKKLLDLVPVTPNAPNDEAEIITNARYWRPAVLEAIAAISKSFNRSYVKQHLDQPTENEKLRAALELALPLVKDDAVVYSEGTHGTRIYVKDVMLSALAQKKDKKVKR